MWSKLVLSVTLVACSHAPPKPPHPGGEQITHYVSWRTNADLCDAPLQEIRDEIAQWGERDLRRFAWESRSAEYNHARACVEAVLESLAEPDLLPRGPIAFDTTQHQVRHIDALDTDRLKRACGYYEAIEATFTTQDFKTSPRNVTEAEALLPPVLACGLLRDLALDKLVSVDRGALDQRLCTFAHDHYLHGEPAIVANDACSRRTTRVVLETSWTYPFSRPDLGQPSDVLPGALAALNGRKPGELGDRTWDLLEKEAFARNETDIDAPAFARALAPHIDALLAKAAQEHRYLDEENKLYNAMHLLDSYRAREVRDLIAKVHDFEEQGEQMYRKLAAEVGPQYPALRAYLQLAADVMRHGRWTPGVALHAGATKTPCNFLDHATTLTGSAPLELPYDVDVEVTSCRDDGKRWQTQDTYDYEVEVADSGGSSTSGCVEVRDVAQTGAADWSHYTQSSSVKCGNSGSSSDTGHHTAHRTGTRTTEHLVVDLHAEAAIRVSRGGHQLATENFAEARRAEDVEYTVPTVKRISIDSAKLEGELREGLRAKVRAAVSQVASKDFLAEGAAAEGRGDTSAAENAYAAAVLLGSRDMHAVDVLMRHYGGVP